MSDLFRLVLRHVLILIIGIIFVMVFVSCSGPAQETTEVSGYGIELLFEKDGCRMYRFYDNGTKWFMTCQGSVTWNDSNGKYSASQRRLQTVVNPQ